MNQKNLNYEIETDCQDRSELRMIVLTMNQKNLNYEIETIITIASLAEAVDYESKESQL